MAPLLFKRKMNLLSISKGHVYRQVSQTRPTSTKEEKWVFFVEVGLSQRLRINPTSESKFMDNWNFNKHKQKITLASLFPRLSRLSGESLGTRLDTHLNRPWVCMERGFYTGLEPRRKRAKFTNAVMDFTLSK